MENPSGKNYNKTVARKPNWLLYGGGAAAVGLGYWWWSRPGQTHKTREFAPETRENKTYNAVKRDAQVAYEDTKAGLSQSVNAAKQGARNIATDLREPAARQELRSEATDKIKESARDLKDKIKEVAITPDTARDVRDTAESVRGAAYDARDRMSSKARDVKEAAYDMREGIKDKARDIAQKEPSVASDLKEAAHVTKEAIKEKGRDLKDSAYAAMDGMKEKSRDTAYAAKEDMKDMARDMKAAASDAKDRIKQRAQELDTSSANPIITQSNRPTTDVAKERLDQLSTDATRDTHLIKSREAQERAERDRDVMRDKELPFTERAKAAGDLALRRAESAYHESTAALQRQAH